MSALVPKVTHDRTMMKGTPSDVFGLDKLPGQAEVIRSVQEGSHAGHQPTGAVKNAINFLGPIPLHTRGRPNSLPTDLSDEDHVVKLGDADLKAVGQIETE